MKNGPNFVNNNLKEFIFECCTCETNLLKEHYVISLCNNDVTASVISKKSSKNSNLDTGR